MGQWMKGQFKFRTGDIDLEERRRRFRKRNEDNDKFACGCGFECEDRVHVVAECPLYDQEREVYMTELGKIEGCDRKKFESWGKQEKAVAILGDKTWPKKARRDVDRIGKTFLRHVWQSRKERLAIGDRSCGNHAPSSRGRVVNVLTAKACKT